MTTNNGSNTQTPDSIIQSIQLQLQQINTIAQNIDTNVTTQISGQGGSLSTEQTKLTEDIASSMDSLSSLQATIFQILTNLQSNLTVTQITSITSSMQSVQMQMTKVQMDASVMIDILTDPSGPIGGLCNQIGSEISGKIQQVNTQIQQLQIQLGQVNTQLNTQLQNAQNSLQTLQNTNASLSSQLQTSQNNLQISQSNLQTAQSSNAVLNTQIESLQNSQDLNKIENQKQWWMWGTIIASGICVTLIIAMIAMKIGHISHEKELIKENIKITSQANQHMQAQYQKQKSR